MNNTWEPKRQKVRDYLRGLRKDAGITQAQLANKLKKPQSYVSKYELGERKLDFVETIEVCEACGNYQLDELVALIKGKTAS